jgi:excisionase family DNA binding protein
MAAPFVRFEEALEELKVSREQLRDWIAKTEIRAFVDGGTFKFRRKDLDAFKTKLQGGSATSALSSTSSPPPSGQEGEAATQAAPSENPEAEPMLLLPDEPEVSPELEIDPENAPAEELELDAAAPEDESGDPLEALEIPGPAPAEGEAQPDAEEPSLTMDTEASGISGEEIALGESGLEGGVEEINLEETLATEEMVLSGADAEIAPLEEIEIGAGGGPSVDSTETLELADEQAEGAATETLELGSGGTLPTETVGALEGEPLGEELFDTDAGLGLQAIQERQSGTPAWTTLSVLSTLVLLFTAGVLIGLQADYVPGYLEPFRQMLAPPGLSK